MLLHVPIPHMLLEISVQKAAKQGGFPGLHTAFHFSIFFISFTSLLLPYLNKGVPNCVCFDWSKQRYITKRRWEVHQQNLLNVSAHQQQPVTSELSHYLQYNHYRQTFT